ncbi:MAG: hypothetical protein N4A74_01675 [Carboxylicivirga sp.]|jgi:hypothetical protein|nr:hypothetical protein [Carboxylicivirga sp.]
MNKFKISKALVIIGIALLLVPNVNAQMQPAKRIEPKIIKGMSLNAPASEVWNLVASPKKFYEAIPEVKELKCPAITKDAKMSFVIPGDSKRQQEVSFFDEHDQSISYYITQSDYYHQPLVYIISVGSDEENSFLQFKAVFSTGDKKEDKRIEELVLGEWLLIKKSLEKKFN